MAMESSKKTFTYRGKTLDELKTLNVREFAKYLKSRQRRVALRQFQDIEDFVNRANKKVANNKQIRTHKRDLIIVPNLIGLKISIYNGHEFIPVDIAKDMIGHRLGEFAPTRTKVKHSGSGVGATKGSKAKAKK